LAPRGQDFLSCMSLRLEPSLPLFPWLSMQNYPIPPPKPPPSKRGDFPRRVLQTYLEMSALSEALPAWLISDFGSRPVPPHTLPPHCFPPPPRLLPPLEFPLTPFLVFRPPPSSCVPVSLLQVCEISCDFSRPTKEDDLPFRSPLLFLFCAFLWSGFVSCPNTSLV